MCVATSRPLCWRGCASFGTASARCCTGSAGDDGRLAAPKRAASRFLAPGRRIGSTANEDDVPGPKAQVIVLAREDREELLRITRAATRAQRDVLRARIVLCAAEGVSNERIALDLSVTDDTVRKWRRRFALDGM